MERGLVIRQPWIDLILRGAKTWEMRSEKTNVRGSIALIERGTGLVVGTARLVDSLPPLRRDNYMSHQGQHAIPHSMLDEVMAAGWVYPWVLSGARRLPVAVPYQHKSGAVKFVLLESAVTEAILRQGGTPAAQDETLPPRSRDPSPKASTAPNIAEPHKTMPSTERKANAQPVSSSGAKLFCFRPEAAQAYGHPVSSGGFVVKAGSTAMREGSPRVKRDREVRDKLVRQGILVPDKNERLYRFSNDHEFSSASQAAGVIKDGNASGPNLWIDETTGKSLREFSS